MGYIAGLLRPVSEFETPFGDAFGMADKAKETSANAIVRDGDHLYVVGRTVLFRYDMRLPEAPRLDGMSDICYDHPEKRSDDRISGYEAHATGAVIYRDNIFIGVRGGGGGISGMGEGVTVGALITVNKNTLEKTGEAAYENKVTGVTIYGDFLIVSLHFHGFYIYRIGDDGALTRVAAHIESARPVTANAREFQNCRVISEKDGKLTLAFACYGYGIGIYLADTISGMVTMLDEDRPYTHKCFKDEKSGLSHTVFGITACDGWVYGGLSLGNNRFRENYKDVDWRSIDRRGVFYGPAKGFSSDIRHMPLPEEDLPGFIGEIGGDPAPAFLCVLKDHLFIGLDAGGVGVAKINADRSLTYLGSTAKDEEGRIVTRCLYTDGERLYVPYRSPVGRPEVGSLVGIFELK